MNFFQYIEKIRDVAKHALCAITTEEATKTALILPMLSALGYDIFNPFELVPEMDCDLSRSGDKVDYAIALNGAVKIIIECKHHNINLANHVPQLMKYYAASDAKCGLITNGIDYWFYSDTVKKNIMDKEPFFKFNLLEMENDMVEQLYMFSKEKFNDDAIQLYINNFEIRRKIASSYRNIVTKVSDELIYLILDSANIVKTQDNVSMCREILASETGLTSKQVEALSVESAVKDILSDIIDTNRIFSVKYKEHETIFLDNQSKWLLRAYPRKGMVIFAPSSEMNTKDFANPSDLSAYADIIKKALQAINQ